MPEARLGPELVFGLALGLALPLMQALAPPPPDLPPERPPVTRSAAAPVPLPEIEWVAPWTETWNRVPPARPLLVLAPVLRVALDRAIEAPLLRVIRPLERLRHLSFQHPVPWDVKRPPEVREFLRQVLERDYPREKSDFDQRMLVTMGLAPQGFEIRSFLEDLLTEQVQGAYDPMVRTFFIVPQGENWLTKALSGDGPSQTDLFTLHELDHALQDQHFDLKGKQLALSEGPRNTDREMGLQALIEGEATLVMMQYQAGDPEAVMPMGWMANTLGDLPAIVPGMGEFSKAPLYFKRSLIMPYYVGMDLVNMVRVMGGWPAVNAMYEDPPVSTEQVLHPEKYTYLRDDPMEVTLALPETLDGWTSLGEDTGGEFLVGVFLEQHGAPAAAEGWGGDRLRLYGKGDETFLVWLIAWDSEDDASEFENSLREAAGPWRAWRSGNRVAVLGGVPPALLPAVRRGLAASRVQRGGPGAGPGS